MKMCTIRIALILVDSQHIGNLYLLSSMQCRDEEYFISRTQFIIAFAQQFPVGVVYQNQNARPHCVTLHEELWPLRQEVIS